MLESDASRYRFMAQVGVQDARPFESLNGIVNELIVAAQQMARPTTVPEWSLRTPEAEEKHHKRLLEVNDVYYGSGGADDPIAPRVESVIQEIERTCRHIIEGAKAPEGVARWLN